MNIIEQIRAEIERRLRREREVKDRYDSNTSSFVEGSIDALDGLLSFLSTLEKEEKPNDQWTDEDERLLSKLEAYVDLECFDRDCNGDDLRFWLRSLRVKKSEKPTFPE